MLVTVWPLTDFVHGSINARVGQPIKMTPSMASDLERAGRVRVVLDSAVNPAAASGKDLDDGQGQPSSVSQAAPAVPPQTVDTLKRGPGRPRKTDT
jgi:hypothetical protein